MMEFVDSNDSTIPTTLPLNDTIINGTDIDTTNQSEKHGDNEIKKIRVK